MAHTAHLCHAGSVEARSLSSATAAAGSQRIAAGRAAGPAASGFPAVAQRDAASARGDPARRAQGRGRQRGGSLESRPGGTAPAAAPKVRLLYVSPKRQLAF